MMCDVIKEKDSEKVFDALMFLADIPYKKKYEIANDYWPPVSQYDYIRTPWWLYQTPWGMIKIGSRKKVISIDWSDTPLRIQIETEETVTKTDSLIHAWSISQALQWLSRLSYHLKIAQEALDAKREKPTELSATP